MVPAMAAVTQSPAVLLRAKARTATAQWAAQSEARLGKVHQAALAAAEAKVAAVRPQGDPIRSLQIAAKLAAARLAAVHPVAAQQAAMRPVADSVAEAQVA